MFTRSPQGGHTPELTPEVVELFKKNLKYTGIPEFYVHTPYFINFASANNRIKYGSISVVRDELERAGEELAVEDAAVFLDQKRGPGLAGFIGFVEQGVDFRGQALVAAESRSRAAGR